MPVSVCINTQNAAATLPRALKSVKSLAAEIIVVDMLSQDDTVAIAKKAGATVYDFKKNWGYADPARNFALSKATEDWILVLDADEEIPAELAQLITELTSAPAATAASGDEIVAYLLPRQNLFFNEWLQHTGWWPDYQVRLFKKGHVSWEVGVHRMPDINGKSMELPADPVRAIRHYNYPTVSSYLQRLDRYTSLAATEQTSAGHKPSTSETSVAVFTRQLLQRLFAQQGWQDGHTGVSAAFLQATYEMSTYLKQAELQEWQGFARQPEVLIDDVAQLRNQLNYWLADWQVQHTRGWRRWWWQLRRKLASTN